MIVILSIPNFFSFSHFSISCFFHVFHVFHISLNPTKRSQGNSQTKKVNPPTFLLFLGGTAFSPPFWEVVLLPHLPWRVLPSPSTFQSVVLLFSLFFVSLPLSSSFLPSLLAFRLTLLLGVWVGLPSPSFSAWGWNPRRNIDPNPRKGGPTLEKTEEEGQPQAQEEGQTP